MRRAVSIMMSCALLMAASQSRANERVRAFVEKSDASKNTFVGQKVAIIVEVLSETHFSGATRIDLPDIAGAVFYKPEERAVVGSRNRW